ncbi:MAG: hypothetical protein GC193_00780 [Cryomorphaceae bacterium]|nr:hypothetical protein [Cryomorphaceae bacterium]
MKALVNFLRSRFIREIYGFVDFIQLVQFFPTTTGSDRIARLIEVINRYNSLFQVLTSETDKALTEILPSANLELKTLRQPLSTVNSILQNPDFKKKFIEEEWDKRRGQVKLIFLEETPSSILKSLAFSEGYGHSLSWSSSTFAEFAILKDILKYYLENRGI